jgi:hypothetical protein
MGTATASARQTIAKTRMPFNCERITTSKSSKKRMGQFLFLLVGRTPQAAHFDQGKDRAI